jgi:N-acetylneuraminic acid mutarotase
MQSPKDHPIIFPLVLCFAVLFFGCDSTDSEIPAQNSWSPIASDGFTLRGQLTASVVGGKIYAIGGNLQSNDSTTDLVEVYDPLTNTWTAPLTSGALVGRESHTASVIDGKIYIIGGAIYHSDGVIGTYEALNTLQVFDPATNTWTTPATSGTFPQRLNHGAAVVAGKIYVFGGDDGEGHSVKTVEAFDPATNVWQMIDSDVTVTPSCVIDSTIYFVLGREILTYNPFIRVWNTIEITDEQLKGVTSADVIDGKIYVIARIGAYFTDYKSVIVFDPVAKTWSDPISQVSIPSPGIYGGFATCVVDRKLYKIGGLGENEVCTPAP